MYTCTYVLSVRAVYSHFENVRRKVSQVIKAVSDSSKRAGRRIEQTTGLNEIKWHKQLEIA